MTTLSRRNVSLGLLAMGATATTGCTPRPHLLAAPLSGQQNTRSVLVATNRTIVPDPKIQFIEGRSDALSFLRYDISIPSNRKLGAYSFPKQNLDPEREFFVARTQHYDTTAQFITGVNTELGQVPDTSGNLMVFVHGFNVSYSGAVFRAAQISTDFDLDTPVVLFSWPSAARVSHYAYDRDSILFARKALADTLATLARTQARKITILAHSMGGFLAMEAVKRLTLEGDTKTLSRIDGVALAQPDIDVDVFRSQMSDIDLDQQFVAVLASGRDRALKLSSVLTGGHPRVGTGNSIEELRRLGVFVIDVSDVGGRDFLKHDTYASSPALLKMIRSGKLTERIIAGAPGQDLLIEGVRLTGQAALAIAYLPYTVSGL
jgi:esterase/lipase superfamily enzyme